MADTALELKAEPTASTLHALMAVLDNIYALQRDNHSENRLTLGALNNSAQLQAGRLTSLELRFETMATTVEKIRKPVEGFVSLRNAVVGLLAFFAAIGGGLTGVFYALPHLLNGGGHS